jgi:alkylhydroperoxidase family enzyme
VLLYSPDLADRIAVVGEQLVYGAAIPAPARALTWLLTAAELDCAYEWTLARAGAQAAGLPASLVDAAGRRQSLPEATTELKVVADFCHQLLRGNHHVSDGVYRAAVECFGVPATVQIAATVGYFVMQGVLLNAFEVAPEGEPSELVL